MTLPPLYADSLGCSRGYSVDAIADLRVGEDGELTVNLPPGREAGPYYYVCLGPGAPTPVEVLADGRVVQR